MTYPETNLGIIDQVEKTRPFVPHLTVAFRDLTKQNFRIAWPEFVQRQFDCEYIATHLTLLLHDGNYWNVKSEFAFLPSVK
jgi:2'-5' RNA ligase